MDASSLKIPDSILDSAHYVTTKAQNVHINPRSLEALLRPIITRLSQGTDSVEAGFGSTGDLASDVNLIFFETAANFCFWAQNEADRWSFDYAGNQTAGWYGLSRAFYMAFQSGLPVHDASFMSKLTLSQARSMFMGAAGVQIPLLETRVNNIIESARFLLDTYSGNALKFIQDNDMSAPEIVKAIVENLPSYRDGCWYQNRWVWILKRAQIFVGDLSQLTQSYPDFHVRQTEKLTAFADYRLPQVLRHYGVLEYSARLAEQIDRKQLIASQSPEEIEIRMATILACEMLKEICDGLTSANIDLALWLLSQDMRSDATVLPHHLTISSYY